MGLSDIHFDRGAFDRAVKFANQAVRAEPKNGDYRLRLGDAYFKVLRYNDARRSYEKADEYGNKKAKDRIKRVREKTGE
jgi:tetratricopeptide (TPR) repeat protein